MKYKLPELKYNYNALEPHFDALTMEIHHSKHHAAYTNNFNNAVAEANLESTDLQDIFASVSKYGNAVRNNGGGFYNHSLFWENLSPNGGGKPQGALLDAIEKDFGSFEEFKKIFSAAAASRFGSGWAWLIKQNGKLKVSSTPNQDNPLMDITEEQGTPILTLDVWEHAYYLKYQNKRPDYIAAFWEVVDWEIASKRFES